MIKRFISVCIVVIWAFNLCGCAQTTKESIVAETEKIQWETEEVAPQAADLDAMAILHEIDDYIEHFTGLYTSNTLGDTASAMIIEEQNFPSDNDNGASLTVYSDSSGKRLRYELRYYGETGNQVINYYLCEDFVWISRQSNYYSSWILTDGDSDILYSEIDNWIIVGETLYIMHDNGSLEEMEITQLEVPLPETFSSNPVSKVKVNETLIEEETASDDFFMAADVSGWKKISCFR